MASLGSLSKSYSKTNAFVPNYVELTGSANYAAHLKSKTEFLSTNHGRIGQDINNGMINIAKFKTMLMIAGIEKTIRPNQYANTSTLRESTKNISTRINLLS
jgi:hypothetical protein